jgi:ribosomal protein S18 acetylase RimI-like enzyme
MVEVQIRQARNQDLEAVLDLWEEMMDFHAGLDERFEPAPDDRDIFRDTLREWIAGEERRVMVAVAEGRIIGYTIGVITENPPIFKMRLYGHVSDICVAPAWRRKGVGRRLFAALRKWFRRHGLTAVQLNVAAFNPASQAFWRGLGFDDYMHKMWLDI